MVIFVPSYVHFYDCEFYYPSVRTENKGLLALFSVRQGRCIDVDNSRRHNTSMTVSQNWHY